MKSNAIYLGNQKLKIENVEHTKYYYAVLDEIQEGTTIESRPVIYEELTPTSERNKGLDNLMFGDVVNVTFNLNQGTNANGIPRRNCKALVKEEIKEEAPF